MTEGQSQQPQEEAKNKKGKWDPIGSYFVSHLYDLAYYRDKKYAVHNDDTVSSCQWRIKNYDYDEVRQSNNLQQCSYNGLKKMVK